MTTPFLETPRFPDDLAFWAKGGVNSSTVVATSTSGRETRNVLWQYGKGKWTLQNVFRTNAPTDNYNIQALRNFFRVVKGQAYGFRFRDWVDYQDEGNGLLAAPVTSLTQAVTPTGLGLGLQVYQMFKRYTASPLADYRLIQKPYTNGCTITRNGSPIPGSGAGSATIDYTTGLVTFVADSSAAVTGWTAGATTQFTVASVPAGWTVGKKLYFSGVTGDTGGVLNGQAVAITGVSGTTITVSANTTGNTLSGGTASMYAQSTDTLMWTGFFDTPCRFETDALDASFDPAGLWALQSSITEVRL